MRTPNAKRPGHLGDGRAAKDDRFQEPIIKESIRNDTVEQAAAWFVANREICPKPVVPSLRQRFGLSALEACRALAMAGRAA